MWKDRYIVLKIGDKYIILMHVEMLHKILFNSNKSVVKQFDRAST